MATIADQMLEGTMKSSAAKRSECYDATLAA
jgi:hypothetical protein